MFPDFIEAMQSIAGPPEVFFKNLVLVLLVFIGLWFLMNFFNALEAQGQMNKRTKKKEEA